jgi:hypothetical protein
LLDSFCEFKINHKRGEVSSNAIREREEEGQKMGGRGRERGEGEKEKKEKKERRKKKRRTLPHLMGFVKFFLDVIGIISSHANRKRVPMATGTIKIISLCGHYVRLLRDMRNTHDEKH